MGLFNSNPLVLSPDLFDTEPKFVQALDLGDMSQVVRFLINKYSSSLGPRA
jgi:hypothetical protein